jgi:elongation factor P
MFVNINDIKNGMTIIIDGKLCVIQEFQHVKPGKGAAIVKIKLKNLKTGSITVESYNSTIKVEKAHIEKKPMTYLYKDGENFVFMDSETYEQVSVPETRLEDEKKYLKENLEIKINFYNGEIIGIELPEKIEYVITDTTEAVKGNTTNNAMKDATLETGYVVKVPLFINNGEHILVSTIDGKYSSRA